MVDPLWKWPSYAYGSDSLICLLMQVSVKYNHCLTSQWILGMIVYTLLSCNIEMLNNVRTRLLITLKPSICPPTSASFLSLKLPLFHSPQLGTWPAPWRPSCSWTPTWPAAGAVGAPSGRCGGSEVTGRLVRLHPMLCYTLQELTTIIFLNW